MKYLTLFLAGAAVLLGSTAAASAQQSSGGQAIAAKFPDGPGRETVVGICSGCHDLVRLTAGYTPEGWLSVTTLMRNFGAPPGAAKLKQATHREREPE